MLIAKRRIAAFAGRIPSREQIQASLGGSCHTGGSSTFSLDQYLAFGCDVMNFFDIEDGAVGVQHNRETGDIKLITFASKPYIHLPYGWCALVKNDGIASLHEIGVLMSGVVNPDQESVVVHADNGNLRALEYELLSLGQELSAARLRELFPEFIWN